MHGFKLYPHGWNKPQPQRREAQEAVRQYQQRGALSQAERVLLAIMQDLSLKTGSCWASVTYLANEMRVSERYVKNLLNGRVRNDTASRYPGLIERGYVIKEERFKETRHGQRRQITNLYRVIKDEPTEAEAAGLKISTAPAVTPHVHAGLPDGAQPVDNSGGGVIRGSPGGVIRGSPPDAGVIHGSPNSIPPEGENPKDGQPPQHPPPAQEISRSEPPVGQGEEISPSDGGTGGREQSQPTSAMAIPLPRLAQERRFALDASQRSKPPPIVHAPPDPGLFDRCQKPKFFNLFRPLYQGDWLRPEARLVKAFGTYRAFLFTFHLGRVRQISRVTAMQAGVILELVVEGEPARTDKVIVPSHELFSRKFWR